MKILVTGAKGFVGRNLVSQLYNIRDGKARNYGIDSEDLAVYEYAEFNLQMQQNSD